MAQIHPTSIVDPRAELADSVYVGPFCTIGPEVKIGDGCWFQSHIVVTGKTTIGSNNKFYAFAAVGIEPQDKKYKGEDTRLVIGDNNVIREHCTLSVGTVQDKVLTEVGSNNLLMANVHIAHDCRVGNNTIIANNVGLAGHVVVCDDAIIGGQSGIHQFVRIGRGAMLSGGSMMRQDVLPFCNYQGYPGAPFGVNIEGMKRHGYSRDAIHTAREVYKLIFRSNLNVSEASEAIKTLCAEITDPQSVMVADTMREFMETSPRGLAR